MKKKQIGFFNVNERKCTDGQETAKEEYDDQTNENTKISEHVYNEIEGHVLAKQEYENSMHKLYLFEKGVAIFKWVCLIIAVIIIVFASYLFGCNKTKQKIKEEYKLAVKFKNMYINGYKTGYQDCKDGKSVQEINFEVLFDEK